MVGENGAFAFWEGEGHHLLTLSHPNAILNTDPRLLALRDRVLSEIPGARLARDQFSRLYDIAIDFAEEEPILPLSEAIRIQSIFMEGGAKAKISSIHVNAWMGEYDKLSMALSFLSARFGYDDKSEVETVIFAGDSPNDEPMFEHFPMACGMANVLKYGELIKKPPHFVTQKESGAGFAELADIFLKRRSVSLLLVAIGLYWPYIYWHNNTDNLLGKCHSSLSRRSRYNDSLFSGFCLSSMKKVI